MVLEKVEVHEYEYGGWEVMGDCGKCGHVRDSLVHLNLYHTMGGPGQPEVLSGFAIVYHFVRFHWNGAALYQNGDNMKERYILPLAKFKRMGQPSHIKVEVDPVWPSGQKVWDA